MKKFVSALLALSVFCIAFASVGCVGDDIEVRGVLYTLEVAYENGWLNEEDLKSIACGYYEFHQFDIYSDYENLYSGMFEPHEALREVSAKEIKQAYLNQIVEHPEFSPDGVTITNYYGTYNKNIVVGVRCEYYKIDIITEAKREIGGVIFYNFWDGSILVYHI